MNIYIGDCLRTGVVSIPATVLAIGQGGEIARSLLRMLLVIGVCGGSRRSSAGWGERGERYRCVRESLGGGKW